MKEPKPHINDKRTAYIHTIISNRKMCTLQDAVTSKSVNSRYYLQKLHTADQIVLCIGIQFLSASGNEISPIELIILDINSRKRKLTPKCSLQKS